MTKALRVSSVSLPRPHILRGTKTGNTGSVLKYFVSGGNGELWIEKASAVSGLDVPYRFTGKERDEETSLYYYGARYLDARTARWLSTDPAMGDYVPQAPIDDASRKRNRNLPGQGGVFNTVNMHAYHYAGNNPIKFIDPDGGYIETPWTIASIVTGAGSLAVNIKSGNFKGAVIDAAGIAVDAATLVVPGLPGGAGFAIKAVKAASVGVDIARVAYAATDIVDSIDGGKTGDVIAGTATIASTVLSRGAVKFFGKAGNYAYATKFGDIGNLMSGAATAIDTGVVAYNAATMENLSSSPTLQQPQQLLQPPAPIPIE